MKKILESMRVLGLLAIFTAVMLASCDQQPTQTPTISMTELLQYNVVIQSIKHDDHLFVVLVNRSAGPYGIIHHPGCVCLKPKE